MLCDVLHIRSAATSLASEPEIASPWMERDHWARVSQTSRRGTYELFLSADDVVIVRPLRRRSPSQSAAEEEVGHGRATGVRRAKGRLTLRLNL